MTLQERMELDDFIRDPTGKPLSFEVLKNSCMSEPTSNNQCLIPDAFVEDIEKLVKERIPLFTEEERAKIRGHNRPVNFDEYQYTHNHQHPTEVDGVKIVQYGCKACALEHYDEQRDENGVPIRARKLLPYINDLPQD